MEPKERTVISFKNHPNSEDGILINTNNVAIIREKVEDHISSSKIKLKNIVDYKWELKTYSGRLVAIHLSGNLIAYSIKVNIKGKTEGMIRVVNVETGRRLLFKGMDSEALDMEFAFTKEPVLLAFIEETALYVLKIEDLGDKIESTLVFKLLDPIGHTPICDKIGWCPYVPESKYENDDYASQLLVWSRSNVFQCYSVHDVSTNYGAGPHKSSDVQEFGLVFKELKSNILDIIYSPDGTTLAVSTEDGYVRFYQIYLHSLEETPRRLHEWKPHNGKPVKKIFFLDNLNQCTSDDSLWKNAITYSEEEQEIKLWCCESWNCLQTIIFKTNDDTPLNMLSAIDKTASYLTMSDMMNRELYVFQIEKTALAGNEARSDNSKTCIRSVAKFPLASPILSFGIASVGVRRYRCAMSDAYLISEMDDYDEESNSLYCVALRMIFVQPKSVQECNLLYQPLVNSNTEIQSSFSSGNNEFQDEIPELVKDANKLKEGKDESSGREPVSETLMSKQKLVDTFEAEDNAKPISKVNDQVLSTLMMLANMQDLQKQPHNANFEAFSNEKKEVESKQEGSGDSSPSREVEKILSLNDVDCFDTYFDDENDTVADDGVVDCVNGLDDKIDETETKPEITDTTQLNRDKWPEAPMAALLPNMTDDRDALRKISQTLTQLVGLVETQSQQISELKKNIVELEKKDSDSHIKDVENTIKLSLSLHEKSQTQTLEQVFKNRDQTEQNHHDAIVESLNQSMRKYLDAVVLSIVNQVKSQLLPEMTSRLERIEHNLANNFKAQKQQSDETLVKLYKNQSVSETLSRNIANSLKGMLQAQIKEMFDSSLIPAYERLSKEMFSQISKIFAFGTQEYTKAFEKHIQQYRLSDEQMHQIANILRLLPEQLNSMNDELQKSNSTAITQSLSKDLRTMQVQLVKVVKEQIKIEVQKRFEEQASSLENSVLSVVRSQAQTPAPTFQNKQEEIISLLQQSQINKAFHTALLANDLFLVEFTIKRADFAKVFSPCCLEQTVLLSLIQQLSADMKNHSENKQRYLTEAVVNLNFTDSAAKEHAPNILRELRQNCINFLNNNPSSPLVSGVKMLMMASQGVGN